MKIEEIILKLDEIAKKLESGETTLDESIQLFNQATEMAEIGTKLLDESKGRLSIVKEKMNKICEENFDDVDL